MFFTEYSFHSAHVYLQVEVLIEKQPEGDGDHAEAEEPEEEVDREHKELQTGVAAVESHPEGLKLIRLNLKSLQFESG